MSRKSKESKPKNQLSLDLNLKSDDFSVNASHDKANQTQTKVVYIDPRREIYKRILDREMK